MNFVEAKWKSRDFLVVLLLLQFMVYAMVILDVPVARQVIGFVYFTFVPGFVIIKLLKIDEVDGLETALYSIGFSIAFLMLAGLFANEIGWILGFLQPLSLRPLMILLNSLILIGEVLVYLRSEDAELFRTETVGISPLAVLFMVLPVLSIVGAIWVNAYENNLALLSMIVALSLSFVVGVISKKIPQKLSSLAIPMIAISLLFHSSLISEYLVTFGSDLEGEYFLFMTTQNTGHWSSIPIYSGEWYGRMNSMLSVTILPTIYSTLLNMNATQVLKILSPIIFCFVPLILYQLWQKTFGKKAAFAAAFLLMAQNTFYAEMLGLTRQMVAELFFALLLLVILNKKIKRSNKMLCFMIFSVALVTSHYALAEIFLFFISLACVCLVLIKQSNRNITLAMVVFFFVVMFAWYIYTSDSATFDSFLSFGNRLYGQLDEFFNLESREYTVLRGLGLESAPTIWSTLSRAFAYLTELFIALGFVKLITRRTNMHAYRIEREHLVFITIAVAFLVALVAVPGLADTLNMTRFYHILLFFLSPLCVVGAGFLVKSVFKREKELGVSVLLLIVLVPYFLFQIGFVYEVTRNESWALPLSSYRMDGRKLYCTLGYMDSQSVFAAQWMHEKADNRRSQVYADFSSIEVLVIYGSIYKGYIESLSNITIVSNNGIVYLSSLNVLHETVVTKSYVCRLDELSFLANLNKIYTNGGSEIHRNLITD